MRPKRAQWLQNFALTGRESFSEPEVTGRFHAYKPPFQPRIYEREPARSLHGIGRPTAEKRISVSLSGPSRQIATAILLERPDNLARARFPSRRPTNAVQAPSSAFEPSAPESVDVPGEGHLALTGRGLRVWLRVVEARLRACLPGAPAAARFGSVSFVPLNHPQVWVNLRSSPPPVPDSLDWRPDGG